MGLIRSVLSIENDQRGGGFGHCASGLHPDGGIHPWGMRGQPGGVLKTLMLKPHVLLSRSGKQIQPQRPSEAEPDMRLASLVLYGSLQETKSYAKTSPRYVTTGQQLIDEN
jgi:hypothetical protein